MALNNTGVSLVTDVRYKLELDTLRELAKQMGAGFVAIRVIRDGLLPITDSSSLHSSETEMDDFKEDVLLRAADLKTLQKRVKRLFRKNARQPKK